MQTHTSSGILAYHPCNRDYARQNRNHMTRAEGLMWNVVLKQKKTSHRFLRQKPIGPYIVDFYCSKLIVAIEIDGETHGFTEAKDHKRDVYLGNLGIHVIRYTNEQIFSELQNVHDHLVRELREREREMSGKTLSRPIGAGIPLNRGRTIGEEWCK